MLSLSHENQANIIESLSSTSRYLDDSLNIGNDYFEEIVDEISRTPVSKLILLTHKHCF